MMRPMHVGFVFFIMKFNPQKIHLRFIFLTSDSFNVYTNIKISSKYINESKINVDGYRFFPSTLKFIGISLSLLVKMGTSFKCNGTNHFCIKHGSLLKNMFLSIFIFGS